MKNNFSKTDLEMIINTYENLFRKVSEFDSIEDLTDYISDKISYYDKQLIDTMYNK